MLVDKAWPTVSVPVPQMRWLGLRLCTQFFLTMLDNLFIYAAVCVQGHGCVQMGTFLPHTGATKRKALSYLKKIAVSMCAAV